MRRTSSFTIAILTNVGVAASAVAQIPPAGPPAQQPPATGAAGQAPAQPRRPRPYAQVITDRAHTEKGGITIHRVDDRYFFEVPDSMLHRDILFVSRLAACLL